MICAFLISSCASYSHSVCCNSVKPAKIICRWHYSLSNQSPNNILLHFSMSLESQHHFRLFKYLLPVDPEALFLKFKLLWWDSWTVILMLLPDLLKTLHRPLTADTFACLTPPALTGSVEIIVAAEVMLKHRLQPWLHMDTAGWGSDACKEQLDAEERRPRGLNNIFFHQVTQCSD